jgi:hypothetical protein
MRGVLRSISTELAQANRPQGGDYWQALMRHGQLAEADAVRRLGTSKKLTAEQKSEALLQQQLAHAERVYKQYGESTGREVLKEFGIDPDTINLVREGREALQHERDKINKILGDPDTAGGKAYVRAWGEIKLQLQGVGNAIAVDLLPHLTQVTHRLGEFIAVSKGSSSLGIVKPIKELTELLATDGPAAAKNLKLIADAVDQVRGIAPVDMSKLVEFGNFDKRMDAFLATWSRRWAEFKSTFGVNFGKLGQNLDVTPEIAAAREKEETAKRAVESDTFEDRFWKEPKGHHQRDRPGMRNPLLLLALRV